MGQDYMMRLMEQVGRMLATVVAHRKAGRNAEAAQEIEASCSETIGLPWDVVRRSSPDAIWESLQQSGGMRFSRAVMLAELLIADAELSIDDGRPADAIRSRLQAFCLLSESIGVLSLDEAAVYRPKLAFLAGQLNAIGGPYIRETLDRYRSRG